MHPCCASEICRCKHITKTAANCQGHMALLAFMPLTSFWTHPSHHLPTAMARYDYNYTTGLPWKSRTRYSLAWQPVFFSPASFWLQLEPAMRAESDAAVHWFTAEKASHIQLHFQRLFIVVGTASDKLALWWHALCYTPCCDLWSSA